MRRARRAGRRAVTLVELIVVIALIGVVIALGRVGANMMIGVMNQSRLLQTQQEAQVALYNLTKDVRNCRAIVEISPDHLKLRMFNFRIGPTNATTFDSVSFGTVTYQYTMSGGDTFIRRTEDFPAVAGHPQFLGQRDMLRNVLIPPTATDFMFDPYPTGTVPPNSSGATIAIRVRSPIFGRVLVYQATSMRRSRSDVGAL